MKRYTATLVLLASALVLGSAHASTDAERVAQVMKMARAAIVMPAAWDGEWATSDTIYTCAGVFQSTSSGTDTICGGKEYSPSVPGSPITINCSGTADATTYTLSCVGSGDVATDCTVNMTMDSHGSMSAGTYFSVGVINMTYSGLACTGLPPLCMQVNTHGTYIGPAPPLYCITPTRRTTWGQVKTIYR